MDRVHVITEDYDHYRDRRNRKFSAELKFIIIVGAIIILCAFIYDRVDNYNRQKQQDTMNNLQNVPNSVYCGMPYEKVKSFLGPGPNRTEEFPLSKVYYWDYTDTKQSVYVSVDRGVVISMRVQPFPFVDITTKEDVLRCVNKNGEWTTAYINTKIIKYA